MKGSQKVILDKIDLISTYNYFVPKSKIVQAVTWLPLIQGTSLTREFAYLIGKGMGDEHLDKNYTFKHSGEKENQVRLRELIINKFGINKKSIKVSQNKYSKGISFQLQINNSVFGRILYLLGIPIGNKTQQPFSVPNWIIENKENSKYFLQGILEDEVATIKIKRINHCCGGMLKMAKIPELLPCLRDFLKE